MKEKNVIINAFFQSKTVLIVAASIVMVDQTLKYKVHQTGGLYICNYGISFGLPLNISLFWLIISLFLLILLYNYEYIIKICAINIYNKFAIGFLFGGILSNILDRLYLNCIIDYIFPIWKILPVFNVADIGIFIGAILLFFNIYLKDIKNCE